MTDPFDRAVIRERLERNEHRLRHAQAGWTWHLKVYLAVNLLLAAIWLVNDGPTSDPWFLWAAGGWAVGLYFHWSGVRARQRKVERLEAQLAGG
ncbi:MAG TPA: 2TM domain-containing protein [Acidimicrobiia bacterium]|nr:2TM domain-containing protein [Acidimicrobiia bacterium]